MTVAAAGDEMRLPADDGQSNDCLSAAKLLLATAPETILLPAALLQSDSTRHSLQSFLRPAECTLPCHHPFFL